MDPTKEHVYKGYVMELTFIEDPLIYCNLFSTLIQDIYRDIQRCRISISKDQNNNSVVPQVNGFGYKYHLIDPHFRLGTMDGKAVIDVKDLKLLVLNVEKERMEDMCRYCSAENATHKCIRCGKVLYCNELWNNIFLIQYIQYESLLLDKNCC